MKSKYLNEIDSIYNKFAIEEIKIIDGKKSSIKQVQYPIDTKERLTFFKTFTSLIRLELEKELFEEVYHNWEKDKIKSELNELENFIKIAESIKLSNIYKERDLKNSHHEYIRLKHNEYLNIGVSDEMFDILSLPAKIYARYFLFKEYLEELLNNPIFEKDLKFAELISEKLKPFKNNFIYEKDIKKATNELNNFFELGCKNTECVITLKKGCIGIMCKMLGDIWKEINGHDVITIDYLSFCKKLFPIFKNQDISSKEVIKTNMYKYLLGGDK